jgi:hypothetical protein
VPWDLADIFSGKSRRGKRVGICEAGSGTPGPARESLSGSRVGSDLPVNCRVAALWSKLEEPGRRIGQRGDATRAPTQVPRPGWAARRRPWASRDWPKSDKSIHSSCNRPIDEQAPSFSAFLLNRHTMRYACSGMATKREFLPTVKPEEPEKIRVPFPGKIAVVRGKRFEDVSSASFVAPSTILAPNSRSMAG